MPLTRMAEFRLMLAGPTMICDVQRLIRWICVSGWLDLCKPAVPGGPPRGISTFRRRLSSTLMTAHQSSVNYPKSPDF